MHNQHCPTELALCCGAMPDTSTREFEACDGLLQTKRSVSEFYGNSNLLRQVSRPILARLPQVAWSFVNGAAPRSGDGPGFPHCCVYPKCQRQCRLDVRPGSRPLAGTQGANGRRDGKLNAFPNAQDLSDCVGCGRMRCCRGATQV